jgi:integrase
LKPGILTVTQAARLLESATPDILPYIAIGLFAGLRRAELERLDWSEIDFAEGHIEVTAEKSKSKIANRFIPIQPNLREWLFPFRKVRGNVTPRGNFRQLFDQARVAAGITAWPDNALRHSFASYHVANFKDAKSLALEMGHTDSGMLYNHYRALVRPKEAERYWNIRPTPVSKVVPMRSKSSAEIKAYMRTAKIAKIGDGSQLPDNFLSANYLSTRKCTLTKSARARISAALI